MDDIDAYTRERGSFDEAAALYKACRRVQSLGFSLKSGGLETCGYSVENLRVAQTRFSALVRRSNANFRDTEAEDKIKEDRGKLLETLTDTQGKYMRHILGLSSHEVEYTRNKTVKLNISFQDALTKLDYFDAKRAMKRYGISKEDQSIYLSVLERFFTARNDYSQLSSARMGDPEFAYEDELKDLRRNYREWDNTKKAIENALF